MVHNIFNRLFCDGEWILAISDNENAVMEILSGSKIKMEMLSGSSGNWYADPFLVKNNGEYYIFAEEYSKKNCKGCIAVAKYKSNNQLEFKKIIENTYHMSYPCVFIKEKKYYMIPETSENNTIELYECIEFPYVWRKKKNLVVNTFAVDVTYFYDGQHDHLMSYDGKNEVIKYDLNCDTWEVKIEYRMYVPVNLGRSAGNIIKYANKFFRPIQDCRYLYGEKIYFNEMTEKMFAENSSYEIDSNRIILNSNINYKRIHTINICNEKIIVDLRIDSYSMKNFINKVYKKIIVLKRKWNKK